MGVVAPGEKKISKCTVQLRKEKKEKKCLCSLPDNRDIAVVEFIMRQVY